MVEVIGRALVAGHRDRHGSARCSRPGERPNDDGTWLPAALIAATIAGKALVDDDCAKRRSPNSPATDQISVERPDQAFWRG
jgi:hypothetical protein